MSSSLPYRLLTPGPVPLPKAVLNCLGQPLLHHRTPEFEQILSRVLSGLGRLFVTDHTVQILTGTGSAGMEAALLNTLSPGDEVLCVISGKFGERWAEMGKVFGLNIHRWEVPWGEELSLSQFSEQLKKYSNVKAVLTQACETSTATLHPIQKMAELTKQHTKALFMVDAITAMGCMELPMQKWNIDVVVAGSQKAFMLPTGLSFIALSESAWQAAQQSQLPKYYFNLLHEKTANSKNQTMFSTPTPLITALAVVLEQIEKNGIRQVQGRCELLAQITQTVGEALGLKVFSKSPSPSVTALVVPSGVSGEAFRDWLESERRITIMGGQDQQKGKILRIGHMGDISNEDMLALFESLAMGLDHFRKSHKALTQWQDLKTEIESGLKKVDKLFP